MTVIDRFVQAVSHGGAMRPTLQVIHSAETPLRAGYAKSIAENWFGKSATTSAHFMVDPVELIRMLSDNVVSYAVGPKANGFTLNWEQAGRASFSRAEWTTDDGMDQMDRLAAGVRERGLANGIPLRWASDDDIRNAARGIPGGICFHDDIRRVLGGTTHTDPVPNYPRDLLMQRIQNGAPTATTSEENELMSKADDILKELAELRGLVKFGGVKVIRNKDTNAMAITSADSWAPIISGDYWTLYVAREWIPNTWQDLAGNEYDHRLSMLDERNAGEILEGIAQLSAAEAARAAAGATVA